MGLTFDELYHLLPHSLTLPRSPFRIKYGAYEVKGVRRSGYRGHRGIGLVTAYVDGFDSGLHDLKQHIFKNTAIPDQIPVGIFHLPDYIQGARNEPGTIPSRTGPKIMLSNRSHEISGAARVDRARTEATHEVCHVFQLAKRGPDDPKRTHWGWINEAVAVYCEQFVHRSGAENCYYCQEWLDSPEVSLDALSYPSSMFIRWFAKKYDPASIGQIWETSGPGDTPLRMIEKVSKQSFDDLFTAYARDAYFLCDPESGCFFPDIYFLWGFREVRDKFRLPAESGNAFEGRLAHLASNYFEVRAGAEVQSIECTLDAAPGLRAQIAAVRHDLWRGSVQEFQPTGPGRLAATMPIVAGDNTEYHLITVSNGLPNLDDAKFKLTVAAAL